MKILRLFLVSLPLWSASLVGCGTPGGSGLATSITVDEARMTPMAFGLQGAAFFTLDGDVPDTLEYAIEPGAEVVSRLTGHEQMYCPLIEANAPGTYRIDVWLDGDDGGDPDASAQVEFVEVAGWHVDTRAFRADGDRGSRDQVYGTNLPAYNSDSFYLQLVDDEGRPLWSYGSLELVSDPAGVYDGLSEVRSVEGRIPFPFARPADDASSAQAVLALTTGQPLPTPEFITVDPDPASWSFEIVQASMAPVHQVTDEYDPVGHDDSPALFFHVNDSNGDPVFVRIPQATFSSSDSISAAGLNPDDTSCGFHIYLADGEDTTTLTFCLEDDWCAETLVTAAIREYTPEECGRRLHQACSLDPAGLSPSKRPLMPIMLLLILGVARWGTRGSSGM